MSNEPLLPFHGILLTLTHRRRATPARCSVVAKWVATQVRAPLMVRVSLALALTLPAPLCLAQARDSAQLILDRYVEAIGGKANLARIQSRVTEATMALGWHINADEETVQQWPDRGVQHVKAGGWGWSGTFSSGFDGKVGWKEGPREPLHPLQGTQLQQYILNLRLDRETRLDELYPVRRLLPDRMIDGKNNHVLELSTTFGTQEIWSFDATTGLLTETDVVQDRGPKDGLVKVVTRLSDYRDVDGVRLPFRMVVQDKERTYTVQVKSVTDNVSIEPRKFAPPEKSP
jgi:zinc protease